MRLGSANLGNRPNKAVLSGLVLFAEQVDVIACQEAGDRRGVIEEFCQYTGWMAWYGTEPGAPSVPILWNPRVVRGSRPGTRPCTDATDCGTCGVGPRRVKAKVWNKMRFTDRAGRTCVVINGHLPASLYCKCRRRLGEQMVDELADMFALRKGHVPTFALMDGNSRPGNRIWKPLRKAKIKQVVRFPTKGARRIDLVWVQGSKAKARAFKRKFSDHRWVIVQTL